MRSSRGITYPLTIRCVSSNRAGAASAKRYQSAGYESVGCPELFVNGRLDTARMQSGVGVGLAQLAYTKYFDACRNKPWFVTSDKFRFSVAVAIAAMSGMAAPVSVLERLSKLADQYDADRYMVPTLEDTQAELTWARMVLCLSECESMPAQEAYHACVGRLHTLTQNQIPYRLSVRTQEELTREKSRVEQARKATNTMQLLGADVAFIEAPIELWGFDIWHNEGPTNKKPGGAVCVVVFRPNQDPKISSGYAEISVRTLQQAQAMFGVDGLLEVLPSLSPTGWTGNSVHARSATGFGAGINKLQATTAARRLSEEAKNRSSAVPVIRC